MKAPRQYLGKYNTYYEGFYKGYDSEYQNQVIDVYSEPLTHFPYTYYKNWDGSVHYIVIYQVLIHGRIQLQAA